MHGGPKVSAAAAGHLSELWHPGDCLFQPAGGEIHPLPTLCVAKQGGAIRRRRHHGAFRRSHRSRAAHRRTLPVDF